MTSYIMTRTLQSIPVLALTSIVIFLFVHFIPGDPAEAVAGFNATPAQLAALRHRYELDRPLVIQYAAWIDRLVHGDLGTAYASQEPISNLILSRLPATIELAIGAMIVTILIGVPVGVLAAVRPFHPMSRLAAFLDAIAIATPSFWLGILLVLFFGVRLKWLPPSGYAPITAHPLAALRHLVLPALTLGTGSSAILVRFVTVSVAEVLTADYVRTAHAKGLHERSVVIRHVLKNALPPVITVMAIQFGYFLGGAVITEAIFGWPGVGLLMLDAVDAREYLIIQDTMLLFVITFIVVNILADVCYAAVNPRVRYTK